MAGVVAGAKIAKVAKTAKAAKAAKTANTIKKVQTISSIKPKPIQPIEVPNKLELVKDLKMEKIRRVVEADQDPKRNGAIEPLTGFYQYKGNKWF